jgi:phosphate transport system substrate-binding protein
MPKAQTIQRTIRSLLISTVLAAAAGSSNAQSLEIAGSGTFQKRIVEPTAQALKAATGVEVKMLASNSAKGLISLAQGKVQVSAASESLADVVESAKKIAADGGGAFTAPATLMYHQIASDEVAVVVNKANSLKALSKSQLRDLLDGKVGNWKQVGGPDLPVRIVMSEPGSATRSLVQKEILDGGAYSKDVVEMRTSSAEVEEIARHAGAIGAVSGATYRKFSDRVRQVKTTTISRPLGLITVGAPTPAVKKTIDFLRGKEARNIYQ